jgi:decaprenylphospho-beta-D-ribofuranose 2-oxidase
MQKKFSPNNQLISRNNALRPEIKFLEHDSPQDTDILQEYFVPVDQYTSFIDEMREIVTKNDVNLINATVRYICFFPSSDNLGIFTHPLEKVYF